MLKQIKESKVVEWIGIHKNELIMAAFVVGITSVSKILSAKMENQKLDKGIYYLTFIKPSELGGFIDTTIEE